MNRIIFFFFLFSVSIIADGQINTFKKSYGGIYADFFYDMAVTSDSGFVMTGRIAKTGANGNLSLDIFLIKTNKYGDTLWTRTFGDSLNEKGHSVIETTDGGFLVTGEGLGLAGYHLIKTDVNGNLLWAKTYQKQGEEYVSVVKQTSDHGFIMAGYTFGGNTDMYIVKTDSAGNLLWSKTYGNIYDDYAEDIQQTYDGGYIITGAYSPPVIPIDIDVILLKIDSLGNPLWSKAFGGSAVDHMDNIQVTPDSGYILAGRTWSFGVGDRDIYLIKTDINGNLLWSKAYGNLYYDLADNVLDADTGYVISGTVQYNSSSPLMSGVIMMTDVIGNLIWAKSFSDSVYSSVIAKNTADGGLGIGYGRGNSIPADFCLDKVLIHGSFECGDTITLIESNPATNVTTPVLLVDSGCTVFTPSMLVGSGSTVYDRCTQVGIMEMNDDLSFSIFPNPSFGFFLVKTGLTIQKGELKIFNVLGRVILKRNINNESEIEINLKNISSGIYFLEITTAANQKFTSKIAINN